MNTLHNLPEKHPFWEIYKAPMKAPKIEEAAKEIYKIVSDDAQEDWGFYDSEIEKYCDKNRIILFDHWQQASESCLNHMGEITVRDCIEFLEIASETYFYKITPEEERSLREDSEQRDIYHTGRA